MYSQCVVKCAHVFLEYDPSAFHYCGKLISLALCKGSLMNFKNSQKQALTHALTLVSVKTWAAITFSYCIHCFQSTRPRGIHIQIPQFKSYAGMRQKERKENDRKRGKRRWIFVINLHLLFLTYRGFSGEKGQQYLRLRRRGGKKRKAKKI